MRALVIRGPGMAAIEQVGEPEVGPGFALIEVERVGVCGTDVELYNGSMVYLQEGFATYPIRPGHEWCGRVREVGSPADDHLVGRRVTGDTMLGCGHCELCLRGRQHLCEDRGEIGIRGGWAGALAHQLAAPVASLHVLPEPVSPLAGALVEPAGSALRSVEACALEPGQRVAILGSGTIGLLAAQFAIALGAEVHLIGRDQGSLSLGAQLGVHQTWLAGEVIGGRFDAVIDATDSASAPATAIEYALPGGRVAFVGLAGSPSHVDTRQLVLKDLVAIGVLSASPALDRVIEFYSTGAVDPTPIVGATVTLEESAKLLTGWRPIGAGMGPKIQIDPTTAASEPTHVKFAPAR